MTSHDQIRAMYKKHGASAKFVRAFCKLQGWRYGAQGAPAEWYEHWPIISRILTSEKP